MRPAGFTAAAISLATALLVTAQAPLPDAARVVELRSSSLRPGTPWAGSHG